MKQSYPQQNQRSTALAIQKNRPTEKALRIWDIAFPLLIITVSLAFVFSLDVIMK